MGLFDNLFNKDLTTNELIPIKKYDDDVSAFELRNEDIKYLDIIQIVTTDLINKSMTEVDYINLLWAKFYKTCSADIKLLALNFPTNTNKQQKYIRYKIEHCSNPVFKYFLETKLAELVYISRNRSDREYYIMLFAENSEMLRDLRDKISSSLVAYGLCMNISKEKKKMVLYKYNNPITSLFSQSEEINNV